MIKQICFCVSMKYRIFYKNEFNGKGNIVHFEQFVLFTQRFQLSSARKVSVFRNIHKCFYFDQAIVKLMVKKSPQGLTYVSEYKSGRYEQKMDHLGCFCGNMPFKLYMGNMLWLTCCYMELG